MPVTCRQRCPNVKILAHEIEGSAESPERVPSLIEKFISFPVEKLLVSLPVLCLESGCDAWSYSSHIVSMSSKHELERRHAMHSRTEAQTDQGPPVALLSTKPRVAS